MNSPSETGRTRDGRAPLITVIGRGHSGTRAMSQTLNASGVFMGAALNESGDLIPPEDMYEACRVMARQVRYLGGNRWDFSRLFSGPVPAEFRRLIASYLSSVLASDAPLRGWKIPETTLVFPWIARLFPDARYIYWVRDPRDCILGRHLTDNLADFGVPGGETDDVRLRRAISWEYQVEMVKATPRPRHWITIRFEDFVLDQERTLKRLEDYLGFALVRIPVRPESVGRWKTDPGKHCFDFFQPDLIEHGYELPAPGPPVAGPATEKAPPAKEEDTTHDTQGLRHVRQRGPGGGVREASLADLARAGSRAQSPRRP